MKAGFLAFEYQLSIKMRRCIFLFFHLAFLKNSSLTTAMQEFW